jgi:hypothetical protein
MLPFHVPATDLQEGLISVVLLPTPRGLVMTQRGKGESKGEEEAAYLSQLVLSLKSAMLKSYFARQVPYGTFVP